MSSAAPLPPPPPHQTPRDPERPPPASAQQQQQQHHHHLHLRTRFRAHRVRESLGKRATKLLCSAFLSLLVIVGVVLFVVWLALRPHRPRFHLVSFSASGLSPPATAGAAPSSLAFSFDVSVRNPNREIGIYYDALYASVFYSDDRVGTAASPSAGPFFQPPKNTTEVVGSAAGAPPPSAAGMIATDAAGGSVGFRLELASTIRFQVSSWLDTRRHHVHVSCDVEVGPDGVLAAAYRDRRCAIYFL